MYGANNYGYNPYGAYIPQRIEQPQQQKPTLNGKIVDGIDTVKGIDIPLDGSCSYFPLASGEAIVTKQLQMDGTSKITIYKPIREENKDIPKYLVQEDLDDLKEEISDLKQEIKDMKKAKKKDE